MSFYNKIPFGLAALKTWVTNSISTAKTTIEQWCNGRFSLNTHTHTISQITGLSAALEGKASTSHTHKLVDIVGGVVGFPNWSSFKNLSINTQYIASSDGWLFYWIGSVPNDTSGTATLNINGHSVTIGYDTIYKYNYGNDCRSAVMYPIKKGDVYNVSVTNNTNIVATLRFYNCR